MMITTRRMIRASRAFWVIWLPQDGPTKSTVILFAGTSNVFSSALVTFTLTLLLPDAGSTFVVTSHWLPRSGELVTWTVESPPPFPDTTREISPCTVLVGPWLAVTG